MNFVNICYCFFLLIFLWYFVIFFGTKLNYCLSLCKMDFQLSFFIFVIYKLVANFSVKWFFFWCCKSEWYSPILTNSCYFLRLTSRVSKFYPIQLFPAIETFIEVIIVLSKSSDKNKTADKVHDNCFQHGDHALIRTVWSYDSWLAMQDIPLSLFFWNTHNYMKLALKPDLVFPGPIFHNWELVSLYL